MTMEEKMQYGEKSVGCWCDSSHGRYIGEEICRMAEERDWTPLNAGYTVEDLTTEGEHYHEAWESAENYMQQFAAPGYWFGSNPDTGDWGLWKVEEED